MRKLILLSIITSAIACSSVEENEQELSSNRIYGEYANADFQQRNEGYDYVAIRIDSLNEYYALMNISARKDKKQPSCELQVIARLADTGLEFESVDNNIIQITATPSGISIQPKNEEASNDLNFYCSGGATIKGEYKSTNLSSIPKEELSFPKLETEEFQLQNINFKVQSTSNIMFNQLMVVPQGLGQDNRPVVWPIEGTVQYTEIEDLNSDGWPEVLSFIKGADKKMSAVGYSVNGGLSMSIIYLPEITNDEAVVYGYQKGEEIRIVETSVIRRFPIYENGFKTKKHRQLRYKLVNGEAARVFKLDGVTEY